MWDRLNAIGLQALGCDPQDYAEEEPEDVTALARDILAWSAGGTEAQATFARLFRSRLLDALGETGNVNCGVCGMPMGRSAPAHTACRRAR